MRKLILPALSLFAAIAVCGIGCGGHGGANQYSLSVARVVKLDQALLLYVNDWDDGICLNGKWMDELTPYDKTPSDYFSPAVGSRGHGYALNTQVAGSFYSQFPDPSTIVSIFDSTDLSLDATDSVSTFPSPPRYGSKNTIGYLDGHVQDQSINVTPPDLYAESQSRLKQCDLGAQIYANDYDEVFPLAKTWMDAETPYTKNQTLFYSPAIGDTGTKYGYAFNIALAGVNLTTIAAPATTLLLFDSTDLSRNATDPITTLPSPPRYGKLNTLAYADGHVP
jgi:hypothetical protein